MTPDLFHFKNKLLILRHFRLGHMPPAQYSTEILAEKGIPLLVVEYGNVSETETQATRPFPKLRIEALWTKSFPKTIKSACLLFNAFLRLTQLIIASGKPKLIVSHGLSESTLAFFLNLFFKIPYIYHVHEVYESSEITGLNRVLLYLEGLVLRQADFLIFPERERANIYKSRYHLKNPIYIVANCPRLSRNIEAVDLRKKYSLPMESFLIGYLGGIGDTNAIREMIVAISKTSNIYFLIWGFSEKTFFSEIKDLILKYQLQEKVFLLGKVEDKLNHLSGLDLTYCYYKENELRTQHILTASNKFTEALCAGAPVLTSSSREFIEFLKKYPVGKCLPSLNTEDMAETLENLKQDKAFLKNASFIAKKLHATLFNYELQFQQALIAYEAFFPASDESKNQASCA